MFHHFLVKKVHFDYFWLEKIYFDYFWIFIYFGSSVSIVTWKEMSMQFLKREISKEKVEHFFVMISCDQKFSCISNFGDYSKTLQMTASQVIDLAKWWLAFDTQWPSKISQNNSFPITISNSNLKMTVFTNRVFLTGPKISHFWGFAVPLLEMFKW